ncbi:MULTISPECIES: ABC transporter ATP-binding protein [Kitasatospora]|uniref:ABC transporter ATP-binding protein n=1 Tax=Kitasatospora cathayae TaxID=3004092 RepID=A0ABY7PWC0_9ACTN|nr:ABC transporter ATP-binding protein [Kitasatospora sp. HUAS 3-15]WBP84693.1 ABC transporter ATP-binding protein [Kitasatospora sp. HUAS 3-15]
MSLTIPAGTVVAVVGEYGSGKTTLVKLLNRFYRPDSGRITVDGVDLSEGQWQKTALARATTRREPLLFGLDEPTASLDVPSEQEVFQRQMARARELAARTGAITVILSHRFSTVTGADLILVLDRGRLEEIGSHQELLARQGRYAELYGIQATAYAES